MSTRKFIVTSTIFGPGTVEVGPDFDASFATSAQPHLRLTWQWRILTAESPAKWHASQRAEALSSRSSSDLDFLDRDEDEDDRDTTDATDTDLTEPFEDPAPQGKWITFVTREGEVLGFQIVKEVK